MEQLARLRARIESLAGLGDLVDALRAVAATHSRQAQEALEGTRRYRQIVADAIAAAMMLPRGAAAQDSATGERALVVLCSEHGFVGGFNEALVTRAGAERAADEEVIFVGRRGALRAEEVGLDGNALSMTTHVAGVPRLARELGERLRPYAGARLLYAAPHGARGSELVVSVVLPLAAARDLGTAPRHPPLTHLSGDLLLRRLAGEYLFGVLADALMQSLVSENAARLRTMEAASRNIGDKLERLRQSERVVRQDEITADLLDVVTGSEAILDQGD